MNEVIIVQNVYKSFGSLQILKNVSISVKAGELLAIQGPSGSGKSTLLGLLGGLDTADSGKIRVKDTEVSKLDEKNLSLYRRRDIGIVFQFFNLIPILNVIENIALPLFPEKVNRKALYLKARTVAEEVGLGHRLDHYPGTLSGGEQQRVAIARALINSPKVIFADEPTGNLDSETGNRIIKLLKDINKQKGLSIVMVTHDDSIAGQADRIIRIKDGEIQNA
ncbi:MAG TPA: macrolide ABC transporter ATP-binding protein [Candidatus Margulisbacteria bacterium]|nr:MAG: macrolide ABC transporter ATP-binding protein [Bacteroidetes bacterium GWF2_43_11]OGI11312.1 MAG: macrolide ABC transporter ATP-binding protein [Candidatus Margulisbacteria bacterium GWE2_39_32]HCT83691.1 macrolide ABC transporter ATP-binding protein [Candidatus Margulisiibacteriota bacterium]